MTFWPIPEFNEVEAIFGAKESQYFRRNDLPDVPPLFEQKAQDLFFQGGKIDTFAPQVDQNKAYNAIRAWLVSWEPAHEAKVATVAYAIWLWSTPEALT